MDLFLQVPGTEATVTICFTAPPKEVRRHAYSGEYKAVVIWKPDPCRNVWSSGWEAPTLTETWNMPGQRIEAIKAIREVTGWDLCNSRRLIEQAFEANWKIVTIRHNPEG